MNVSLPFRGLRCQDLPELHTPGPAEIMKATWIVLATIVIVSLNILMIAVLQSRKHARYLREQPRLLMTSLACTDLCVGILVTPFGVYPALYHCWPFGYALCAMTALFISALFHQSTLALMLVAVDRYMCIVHPLRYNSLMTYKVSCILAIVSWITSFTVYSLIIYPRGLFYFDHTGIQTCEPYYTQKNTIIIAVCLFYFPPLMVLLYCYLSIFFVAKRQMNAFKSESVSSISTGFGRIDSVQKMHSKERARTYQTTVTLAAIACAFVIAVTPWTLKELIASCLEIQVTDSVEFAVTWVAVSNSFWNPIIYGILSKSFRKAMWDIFWMILRKKKPPTKAGKSKSSSNETT